MRAFIKISITPFVVGAIAAILVFVDSIVAPLFVIGASFTWIAFINWTVFFGAIFKDRIKAIIGYVIGFLSANAIIILGSLIENVIAFKFVNIPIATIIAVFIINFLVMYFDKAKKLFMDSISGIFVGIALTFSGAGVQLQANNIKLLLVIIVYGVFGLLCGLGTNYFSKCISSRLKE